MFSRFKDGEARELEPAEDEKEIKKSSSKGKGEGPVVHQGPGGHPGDVGFGPNK